MGRTSTRGKSKKELAQMGKNISDDDTAPMDVESPTEDPATISLPVDATETATQKLEKPKPTVPVTPDVEKRAEKPLVAEKQSVVKAKPTACKIKFCKPGGKQICVQSSSLNANTFF